MVNCWLLDQRFHSSEEDSFNETFVITSSAETTFIVLSIRGKVYYPNIVTFMRDLLVDIDSTFKASYSLG
jgi:hypothetical protein